MVQMLLHMSNSFVRKPSKNSGSINNIIIFV